MVQKISTWLRAVRHRRGLSQEQVAHSAGIAVSTYTRLECHSSRGTANPTVSTMSKLCAALNVTLAELADLSMAEEPLDPARSNA